MNWNVRRRSTGNALNWTVGKLATPYRHRFPRDQSVKPTFSSTVSTMPLRAAVAKRCPCWPVFAVFGRITFKRGLPAASVTMLWRVDGCGHGVRRLRGVATGFSRCIFQSRARVFETPAYAEADVDFTRALELKANS